MSLSFTSCEVRPAQLPPWGSRSQWVGFGGQHTWYGMPQMCGAGRGLVAGLTVLEHPDAVVGVCSSIPRPWG